LPQKKLLATGDSLRLSIDSETLSVLSIERAEVNFAGDRSGVIIPVPASRYPSSTGGTNMRVFVTGATGFIGLPLVRELIAAGHQVLGLARSDAGAQSIAAAGAHVQRGDLTDPDSLRSGSSAADAVVHLGFIHDFSKFQESCEVDKRAIETLGEVLAGSDRPLIVTGGLAVSAPGRLATEDDPPLPVSERYPRASEHTAIAMEKRGVRAMVVRVPQVHDTTKAGLVTQLIRIAREKGVSPWIGDGSNRWAAAHVLDAAHLYRLALEKGHAGARYHAVAEEGVTLRAIAETIGRRLKVPARSISPEEAVEHFGWLALFGGRDLQGSSARTRQELGWNPTGPALLTDLENMDD
jgi:nucleoside-diphosphate-sugar epimerase